MYTCETGMKAAIMKSTEPTRRKAAATRSDLIEALVALPPACYRRGGRIAPLYHATRRTSAHLCLFTEVPRMGVLRTSRVTNSRTFAVLAWRCGRFVARVSWARATGLTRCAQAGGRSRHRVRHGRNEPRGPRLLWAGLRLSRGGDKGRAREGALHRSALRRDGGRGAGLPGYGRRGPGVPHLLPGDPPHPHAQRRRRAAPLRLERL